MKELNSNNLKTKIHWVCADCGQRAEKETFGKARERISTFHLGKCDFCGKKKAITETRDFGYPDFNLTKKQ